MVELAFAKTVAVLATINDSFEVDLFALINFFYINMNVDLLTKSSFFKKNQIKIYFFLAKYKLYFSQY